MSQQVLAVGVNHTSAPVELREKLAVPESEQVRYLRSLAEGAGLSEVMLVSTCNRVEVYGVAGDWARTAEEVMNGLASLRGMNPGDLAGKSFVRGSDAAVRHIFRVAAALDSMVVGEPQILGQVKEAWETARGAGTVGPVLDRCLTMAFKGAKRARAETGLARGAASVPSVASDLARSIFGEMTGRSVLVVGAGEMAEQAAVHLRASGASEIVVVNRSPERGQALADKVDGRYEEFDRLEQQLRRADVVVTSTGSELPVISRKLMKPVMKARRYEPLFLVDIAVPRDVEPDAGKLDAVYLYNIDDLQSIVHDNMRARAAEADRAGVLVDEEVDTFVRWQRMRAVGPLIGKLQGHAREIAQAEVARALRKLPDLSPEQQEAVEALAHGIVKKVLHAPVSRLRDASSQDGPMGAALAEALQHLFELREEGDTVSRPQAAPKGVPETP